MKFFVVITIPLLVFFAVNIIGSDKGKVYNGRIAPGCLEIDYRCVEAWKEEKGLKNDTFSGYRYK
jgi:hypothetical protein